VSEFRSEPEKHMFVAIHRAGFGIMNPGFDAACALVGSSGIRGALSVFELRVAGSFSSAHFLRAYRGACSSVHGHNWKVEAIYRGSEANELGMIEDLKSLRSSLEEVLAEFDHRNLNELPAFQKENPTSENIAKLIYHKLKRHPVSGNCRLTGVKVAESETSSVCYYEDA